MSKGWTLAPQRCCSLWELLSSWLASCTRTQPGLCIVCGSSSHSLWTRHPDQEVFHFLLQGLKTTCMQCSRHTCLSCLLELGHLTLLLNLAFFSLGQPWISQPCHSPYESGNQKWHPALLDRSGVFLGHPAHTAYSKETLWRLPAVRSYSFFLAVKGLFSFTPELF